MSELADALLLSRSGVTRLVDRMVAEGLVERVTCETDRRGQWATLTRAGYARLRAATPVHLRGVTEHFLDRIDPGDLAALERMLGPVGPD
jgi:DNA-binding MarR family transcriptional regulator